jgi:hypothetical protein
MGSRITQHWHILAALSLIARRWLWIINCGGRTGGTGGNASRPGWREPSELDHSRPSRARAARICRTPRRPPTALIVKQRFPRGVAWVTLTLCLGFTGSIE